MCHEFGHCMGLEDYYKPDVEDDYDAMHGVAGTEMMDEMTEINDFMGTLTRRIDAVEFVRQHQEATIRRYKLAMVIAFAVGIASGAITIALVMSSPTNIPLFTVHVQSGILLWLAENSRVILTTILALLMSLGMMSIISNVQDILQLQKNHILIKGK